MKKLGLLSIGETPRPDILSVMSRELPDTELVEYGILDALDERQRQSLKPLPGDFPLVSRKRDGSQFSLGKKQAVELMEQGLRRLHEQGIAVVVLLCTCRFSLNIPEGMLVVEAGRVIDAALEALARDGMTTGLLTPLPSQADELAAHYAYLPGRLVTASASPYEDVRFCRSCGGTSQRGGFRLSALHGVHGTVQSRSTSRMRLSRHTRKQSGGPFCGRTDECSGVGMFYPRIDLERCVGCSACVRVCPSSQLCLREGKASVCAVVPRPCHGCGHCSAVCPKDAVGIWEDSHELERPSVECGNWRIPTERLAVFLQMRRSVRFFSSRPVEKSLLLELFDKVRWAPTACNHQDVGWMVLTDPELRKKLGEAIAEWALTSENYRSIGEEYRRGHDTACAMPRASFWRMPRQRFPPAFRTVPLLLRIWNFCWPRPVWEAAGPALSPTWLRKGRS